MMGGLTVRYDMIISGQRGGGDYTEITQRLHRDYTERRKTKRKKGNVPNQHS
jgi:hypothetical protein